jgi:hypothetical protein
MSKDLVQDIKDMHKKFGVDTWVADKMSGDPTHFKSIMNEYLKFRQTQIQEEVDELYTAINTRDAEEVVDALIDTLVFAFVTLDTMGVDANVAWDKVYNANMTKLPGVNPTRYNPLNLPDMVKPENWVSPTHEGNHGIIPNFI